MMNVLDALRYRLAGSMTDTEGERIDPNSLEAMVLRNRPQQQLPPGLPLVVQDAIRNQPSYQEGGQFMAPPWHHPTFGEEWLPAGSPERRENRLNFDRREALMIPDPSTPNPWERDMPEGGVWSSRPAGVSPFASPLNQLMQRGRRLPLFGQY